MAERINPIYKITGAAMTAGGLSISGAYYSLKDRPVLAVVLLAGSYIPLAYAHHKIIRSRREFLLSTVILKVVERMTHLRSDLSFKFPLEEFPRDAISIIDLEGNRNPILVRSDLAIVDGEVRGSEIDLVELKQDSTLPDGLKKIFKRKIPKNLLVFPLDRWFWNRYDQNSEPVGYQSGCLLTRQKFRGQDIDFWAVDIEGIHPRQK